MVVEIEKAITGLGTEELSTLARLAEKSIPELLPSLDPLLLHRPGVEADVFKRIHERAGCQTKEVFNGFEDWGFFDVDGPVAVPTTCLVCSIHGVKSQPFIGNPRE